MSRTRLYNRLPLVWKRLDNDGTLEDYLKVFDNAFDSVEAKANAILLLQNADTISDKYLPLIASKVGHKWDSNKTYNWNRERILHAIDRYSYKGTNISIEDLLRDYGADWWKITDQASRLDIWNRQGGWNSPSGVVMDANFWHDGAYYLEVNHSLDFNGFLEEFETIKRAGTVWYFNVYIEPIVISTGIEATSSIDTEIHSSFVDYSGLMWNWPTHSNCMVEEITN